MRTALLLALVMTALACGEAPATDSAAPPPPATVQSPTPEAQLARVTLSPAAEAHLAIETAAVNLRSVSPARTVGGEAVVPPGRFVTVSAPVAGTLAAPVAGAAGLGPVRAGDVLLELLPLQQSERNLRTEAERDAGEAEARLTEASQRLERVEQLLREGSASERAAEEARAGRAVAAAAAAAARSRLATVGRLPVGPRGEIALTAPFDGSVTALRGAPGQTVAAGAPVAELAQIDPLWIRVPVYAGDLAGIDTSRPASFSRLGEESTSAWREARWVTGPPAADPAANSIDLFFALPNAGGAIRPGERLAVRLPLRSEQRALVIPQSAVVYDVGGGTWVYEALGDHVFARRRVELDDLLGSDVVVLRGLDEGTLVVTTGAAELFSTEFYVKR